MKFLPNGTKCYKFCSTCKFPFTLWSRDPFFEGQKSAVGSTANVDQHKILFPLVHNTIGLVTETNLPFAQ